MIAHASVNVSDYQKSKDFYLAALKPLGFNIVKELPEWKVAGFGVEHGDLWIYGMGCKQGTHVAFHAKNKEEVDAFYKAAMEAGGKDNGAPGYETEYAPGYYAAFVYDLDGNNIEAVWMDPTK